MSPELLVLVLAVVIVVVVVIPSASRPSRGAPLPASRELVRPLVPLVARMAVHVRRPQASAEVIVGLRPERSDAFCQASVLAW